MSSQAPKLETTPLYLNFALGIEETWPFYIFLIRCPKTDLNIKDCYGCAANNCSFLLTESRRENGKVASLCLNLHVCMVTARLLQTHEMSTAVAFVFLMSCFSRVCHYSQRTWMSGYSESLCFGEQTLKIWGLSRQCSHTWYVSNTWVPGSAP